MAESLVFSHANLTLHVALRDRFLFEILARAVQFTIVSLGYLHASITCFPGLLNCLAIATR